jgi:hypothetical protein
MPRPGRKYFHALNNPGPKTGRCYAAVVAPLRAVIAHIEGSFTWEAVARHVPAISRRRIKNALAEFYRTGELKRLCKGKYGRHSNKPPVYRKKP